MNPDGVGLQVLVLVVVAQHNGHIEAGAVLQQAAGKRQPQVDEKILWILFSQMCVKTSNLLRTAVAEIRTNQKMDSL